VDSDPVSPKIQLAKALQKLWVRAGRPSYRQIAQDADHKISHTHIGHKLRGVHVGSWYKTAILVKALGGNPDDYVELWRAAGGVLYSDELLPIQSPGPRTLSERAELTQALNRIADILEILMKDHNGQD
jgi:hypothetical protein